MPDHQPASLPVRPLHRQRPQRPCTGQSEHHDDRPVQGPMQLLPRPDRDRRPDPPRPRWRQLGPRRPPPARLTLEMRPSPLCAVSGFHTTALHCTSLHGFQAAAIFYPNFYPKRQRSGVEMPYLLVTAASWRGLRESVTSLPSWSCGFDSRRPFRRPLHAGGAGAPLASIRHDLDCALRMTCRNA